jgi:short-subunit dehydrogenase
MKDLNGATALLTGASGGIGASIADELASAGANLILTGRREDALAEVRERLAARGQKAAVVPADLADLDAIPSLVEDAEAALGPIDILVNNAGVELAASFTEFSRDEITSMVDVNLTAPMLLTQRVLPGMLRRGRGHVVFLSSGAGRYGPAYQHPYAATKAGLIALTQSLRAEYRGGPVGFSVICPGLVLGDGMYQRIVDDGIRGSRLMGSTTTGRVAKRVVQAIRTDAPEIIVTGSPMRPLIALGVFAPRLTEGIMARVGMTELFHRLAATHGRSA